MKYIPLPGHEHPMVNHFEGTNVASFQDGTKAEVDVVRFLICLQYSKDMYANLVNFEVYLKVPVS